MYWFLLTLAGLFEIAFAISLKYSDGLTKLKPSLAFILFGALSFTCLAKTLNKSYRYSLCRVDRYWRCRYSTAWYINF